ncbi:hypothetical protein E0H39_35790 [Rhizobium leguminosarum bv. viciae]|uniref:hypothetical protein n=1 Tax=Rhizobium leguminosarum TaxID=384 RepID=UPI000E0FB3D2|nr:hypothetical protein [Rhizobium leguminosarum]NEJ80345.1 hypothetical protein [Rhizobium leguminosarum]TBY19158.1 hypothetical protein E0H37_32470 [Rhizobium leguminosarum bv. viciae]TBY26689.1 hypothetical protein E0H30_03940 [Rhizobium leguminosarum bv. viciae]TBY54142.1 hypothetical protein E0H39_35790 [Rhizobium leguminosarum bv. viciae]TBY99394.1 hypothetical protein E0H49_18240 [Rhizobium leguminosarum bv. viciae]
MMTLAPRIGFDRFIALEWATTALKVRAGTANLDDLESLLDDAGLGAAARVKTRTVLKRLWLEPRVELVDFADRGAAIFKAYPDVPVTAMHWGMAVATYPFFGKVAELIGRLSAIQGDCASAEIHRRMSETYGEREGTYRMTNMVIQSQASWGAVERVEKGKRVLRRAPAAVENDELTVWLIEAAARTADRPLAIPSLQSLPVLFPFNLTRPLAYLVSNTERLVVRAEGPNNQSVALRCAI